MTIIDNNNLKTLEKELRKELPKEYVKIMDDILEIIEFYYDDRDIKDSVDMFINKANAYLEKKEKEEISNQEAEIALEVLQAKKKESSKKSSKEDVQQPDPELVGKVDPAVSYIKRYTLCHGKERTLKYMKSLLTSLQRAIIAEQITKRNPHYDEIKVIEKELARVIEKAVDEKLEYIKMSINKERLAIYQLISSSEKVRPSVNALKRFVGLTGKDDVEDSAERLYKYVVRLLEKSPRDKNADRLKAVRDILKRYLNATNSLLPVDKFSLAGIGANKGIIEALELANMRFRKLNLTGQWRKVIGDVTLPFSIMAFGAPGSGKSTFALRFAAYLAKEKDMKILYVASEEGFGATLQDKLNRAGAVHPNIHISMSLPGNPTDYDVIFIDSVNEMGFEPDDISKLLHTWTPLSVNFFLVYRGTKSGTFRGEETHENLVDVSIKIEDGITSIRKNRFGGSGSMNIF